MMKVQEMIEKYLEDVYVTKTHATYNFYYCHLMYVKNYLDTVSIYNSDEITMKVIKDYIIHEHENSVSNATINKRILAIKQIYKFFNIDNEILQLKKLREERVTFNALSRYELNLLKNYILTDKLSLKNRCVMSVLIDTGVRVNELLNIKINNININSKTIYLEVTKTKEHRIVPFTDFTASLLKDYIKLVGLKNGILFNLTASGLASLFAKIKKELGFNDFHPHMLRHTLASNLHSKGLPIVMIQKIMGHHNLSTTERYIHFDLDDLVNSYNSIMNLSI